MKWQWPWHRAAAPDKSAEAKELIAKLDKSEPEIKKLGHELRSRQKQNHFSMMVREAIARGSQEEGI